MNTFEIGERIRDLRKKHRMTQAEVARKICVSSPTITQWENNQTSPKGELLKVCPFLRLKSIGSSGHKNPIICLFFHKKYNKIKHNKMGQTVDSKSTLFNKFRHFRLSSSKSSYPKIAIFSTRFHNVYSFSCFLNMSIFPVL